MEAHDWWHLVVLGSTLFGAAGLAIVGLSSLVFEEPPPGLTAWKPVVLVLVGVAAVLLGLEWLGVH
jgi:hypothetical protein